MRARLKFIFPGGMLCIIALFQCCDVPDLRELDDNKITLIWNKSYEGQTQQDIKTGMIWALSWLGAELPKGSFDKACSWKDTTQFTINLDSVGFPPEARGALWSICDSIRSSIEYQEYGGIDVGKFVMLTLNSSWHYYAITGVPKTLKDFRVRYNVGNDAFVFGVTSSSVAEGHRRILFSRDTALFYCGFIAEEGAGSLTRSQFTPTFYECFDIMPNGQLRFMIYNAEGNLVEGSPLATGDAGKPAKCLWCHETHIQSLFIPNEPVDSMLTNEEFLVMRDSMQARLERYRLTLNTDVNWRKQTDHTSAELLYITFMEPTVMHMLNEWKMTEPQVRDLLKYEEHGRFKEFDFIGEVYQRSAVDAQDSIYNLEVPVSARETGREVNYLK